MTRPNPWSDWRTRTNWHLSENSPPPQPNKSSRRVHHSSFRTRFRISTGRCVCPSVRLHVNPSVRSSIPSSIGLLLMRCFEAANAVSPALLRLFPSHFLSLTHPSSSTYFHAVHLYLRLFYCAQGEVLNKYQLSRDDDTRDYLSTLIIK